MIPQKLTAGFTTISRPLLHIYYRYVNSSPHLPFDQPILRTYWANAKPIVTVVVVPVHTAGIEVHAPREVRVVREERTRPIVAVSACIEERTVAAVARCGEEDTITVALAGYLISPHSILSS